MTARYSRISGTGGYLPAKVLTNAELEKMVDTTGQWIVERTGIRERRIAAVGETTCDLAEQAARRAIEAARLTPTDIDLIIVATTTPDRIFPSTACLLQQRLDIHGCPAFDIQAVCTGFIYALDIADRFIRTGGARRALVVGADVMSRITDWSDRGTCVLFGDGAGAVVLEASDEPGILSSHLHADGQYQDLLMVPAGVSQNYSDVVAPGVLPPATLVGSFATALPCTSLRGKAYIQMQGNEVFKVAVNTLGRIVDETLEANNLPQSAIDWLIPHQANIRIIEATAKKLKMPMERVIVTVGEHGNTSAASVPLALDVAVRDGRIKRGETLLLEAFGGGFTWGSTLLKY